LLDSILIAIGANLPSPEFGPPRAICEAALRELSRRGLRIVRRSRWFETAPIPASDQPWYVNGVAAVETALSPEALLALLHEVERRFGRERRELNAARILDLDIVAYGDLVRTDPPPILPHPRMHERAFVLLPLADVAPDWRHPVDGRPLSELLRALPAEQLIRPLADGP
jgi:2-amino-4-hydroxy-6-hydroxymethyldihydropteridine diphosphokinase